MKLTPCGWAFLRAEPQVGVRKKQTIKHTPNMLRIAIQAKGRLNEQSIDLLSEAGIRVAESKRKLISRAEGFPLEVLYLRDDDIPQAVSMGVADLGIVGLNEVAEKGFPVEQIMDLGFGGCRLSLAVPKTTAYEGLAFFRGRRVATSYPNILARYFAEKGIEAEIHTIEGSVEIAPAVGMADGSGFMGEHFAKYGDYNVHDDPREGGSAELGERYLAAGVATLVAQVRAAWEQIDR